MAAKVLLIEDDLFLRDIYRDFLKGEGYDVAVAVDGEEGLEKIKISGWDLVLVDDNLPKLMGVDVLKEARRIKPPASKKFVFLTNDTAPSDKNDDRLKLSDGFMVKSEYSPAQLVEALKQFISV